MSAATPADPRLRTLRRGLQGLALRASRLLSARAQARLDLTLEGIEILTSGELADRLGPRDVGVAVTFGGGSPAAVVLPSRGLAFALLALRFGARVGAVGTVPDRGYTRIEERSLERTAAEIWAAFRAEAADLPDVGGRVGGLVDAERLREGGETRLGLARFDVRGLPHDEMLALALPWEIATAAAGGDRSADAA